MSPVINYNLNDPLEDLKPARANLKREGVSNDEGEGARVGLDGDKQQRNLQSVDKYERLKNGKSYHGFGVRAVT